MAKYSTGSSSDGAATSCELCGAESESLRREQVAGATLQVCSNCATHGDDPTSSSGSSGSSGGSGGAGGSDRDRRKQAAANVARASPIWDGDSEHWERDGTNYDDDPLPYLAPDYGDVAESARQDAGYTVPELADELGTTEAAILAVEQGRAVQAGIGGGLIDAMEDHLDVTLAE